MSALRHISLRPFSVLCLIVSFLWLSACGEEPCDITGAWEGLAGESQIACKFSPDGDASFSMTVNNQTTTTRCRWSLVGRKISITSTRGETRWFAIANCGDDELTLRLGSGPSGLCQLRRIGDN